MISAKLIFSKFIGAGLGTGVAAAAVVNAIGESQLSNEAISSTGAIGLFQLGHWGAGTGMTAAQMHDPRQNIDRIIAIIKGTVAHPKLGSGTGQRLMGMRHTASIAQLSTVFCEDIERPGPGECSRRATIARSIFGSYADVPTSQLPYIPRPIGWVVAAPWWYWALASPAVVGGTAYTYYAAKKKSFTPWRKR